MKENNGEIDTRNVVKNRELLYRMIISQLFYDGFQPIAATRRRRRWTLGASSKGTLSSGHCKLHFGCGENAGQVGAGGGGPWARAARTPCHQDIVSYILDVERMLAQSAPEEVDPGREQQGHCHQDIVSYILDVERMLAKSAPEEVDPGREQQGHPVIRTL
ncbi:Uncharacterized protein OBRU01_12986 [Operophtera brumata]|uniref:Cleavage stimulation factor subunit 1 dimerisation domain-containing protein n=1 Tax=Operophtera brumata TaxID=104452 RepID=A0A0L7L9H0_OPEBR|nr:Uncharacterized protein OBRU01_12986 [Operophtera brumata]